MARLHRTLLAGVLVLAGCQEAPRTGPRTPTELIRSSGLTPGPEVAVFVDGMPWGADTLDRLDLKEVQRMEVLRDTAAIRALGFGPHRAVVLLRTDVPPWEE